MRILSNLSLHLLLALMLCGSVRAAETPSVDEIKALRQDLESIHAQAVKAAEAAHCAGEHGKYWELHDKLFANQKALAPENLAEHAKAIGIKAEPFKKCLESGKYAERVRSGIAEGQKLGITGTPTLLLGVSDGTRVNLVRMMVGALPFALYKEEIDKLLAE